jgi:hypothetical protein
MAVDDRLALRKPRTKPLVAAVARAGIVNETQAKAARIDNRAFRKHGPKIRGVHVSVHRFHLGQFAKLREHAHGDEIPHVDDELRAGEHTDALVRKPPGAAREVCIADERDQGTGTLTSPVAPRPVHAGSSRKRPSR